MRRFPRDHRRPRRDCARNSPLFLPSGTTVDVAHGKNKDAARQFSRAESRTSEKMQAARRQAIEKRRSRRATIHVSQASTEEAADFLKAITRSIAQFAHSGTPKRQRIPLTTTSLRSDVSCHTRGALPSQQRAVASAKRRRYWTRCHWISICEAGEGGPKRLPRFGSREATNSMGYCLPTPRAAAVITQQSTDLARSARNWTWT